MIIRILGMYSSSLIKLSLLVLENMPFSLFSMYVGNEEQRNAYTFLRGENCHLLSESFGFDCLLEWQSEPDWSQGDVIFSEETSFVHENWDEQVVPWCGNVSS